MKQSKEKKKEDKSVLSMPILTFIFDEVRAGFATIGIVEEGSIPHSSTILNGTAVRLPAAPHSCWQIEILSGLRTSYPAKGTLDSDVVSTNPCMFKTSRKCSKHEVELSKSGDGSQVPWRPKV